MAKITITIDVEDLDEKLAAARRLVELYDQAARLAAELAGGAPRRPDPPRSASTNGHRPTKTPTSEKRTRRQFTDEQKAAGAARAREVGVTKAAEEFDVVPTVVRGWLKKHPKEHAVAEPIRGTPRAADESREDWEARKRAAAGAAL